VLVRVAQAIAECKVKPTISDLDQLIRLEESLRQEDPDERPKIIIEWRDYDSSGKLISKISSEDNASTTPIEDEG
jgi:hypothetical protein